MTREESRQVTRRRLLDAAAIVFAKRGYRRASVEEISTEAGYTIGALYSNFAGKEELFFAVYERRLSERVAQLDQLVEDAPSARAALDAAVESARGRGEDGWLAVFFEFWAHVLRHPEHRARFAALHRRGLEPFLRANEQLAREHGAEPPLSPALMATAQLALGNGLQLERLTRPDEIDMESFQQAMWLLARGGAPPAEGASG